MRLTARKAREPRSAEPDAEVRRASSKANAVAGFAMAAMAVACVLPPAASAATQTLSVAKAGTGAGTVTSSPLGINCGGTCSFAFTEGATVTLTGTAGANSAAVVWSGCETVTIEKKCKVTMSAAKSVTATFDLLKRKLIVEKKGTGSGTVTSSPAGIECGQTCSAEYDNGTEVTLTGSAGANTEAVKWTGCTTVTGENKCLVTMNALKSVTATFRLVQHQLSVTRGGAGAGTVTSSPAGINCGSICSSSFDHGTQVILTGASGVNTLPVAWSGCDSVTDEGKCVVTMSEAREVTALFNVEGPQLRITKLGNGTGIVTSSPAGIECGGACAVNFVNGTTVTLMGTAGLHTQAVKWSGCDSVNGQNKCLATMSSAREVVATFALEPQWVEYTITLNTTKGTGKGTVQSSPAGIECPGDCRQAYLAKTQLLLTATPAPGSALDHWSVSACGEALLCETSVRSSHQINAIFVAVGNRMLSVSKAGSGQGTVASTNVTAIDCGSVCSAELDAKTKVTLKATPAAGSTFTGWSGEGCSGTKSCHVTMNEARNVTASFAQVPPGPSELLVAGRAKVKAGRALLKLACEGGSPCQGSLKLLVKVRNAQGQTKGLVIAQGSYELAAGARRTLAVKLSSRAKRLLGGAVSLGARVTGTGIDSHAVRLAAGGQGDHI